MVDAELDAAFVVHDGHRMRLRGDSLVAAAALAVRVGLSAEILAIRVGLSKNMLYKIASEHGVHWPLERPNPWRRA